MFKKITRVPLAKLKKDNYRSGKLTLRIIHCNFSTLVTRLNLLMKFTMNTCQGLMKKSVNLNIDMSS